MNLRKRNFVILDIEYIRTLENHCCIRKLYLLSKDGIQEREADLVPCQHFKDMEQKYQNSFLYCKRNIHHLPFYPKKRIFKCYYARRIIEEFMDITGADLVLYKGGNIERNLCNRMGLESYNIEELGVKKVTTHDPREEVNIHYNFLLNEELF